MNEGSLPWWTPRAVLTCVMKRRLSGAIAAVSRILPVHARSVPGPARPLLRQNRTKRHDAPPSHGKLCKPAESFTCLCVVLLWSFLEGMVSVVFVCGVFLCCFCVL